MSKMDEFKKFVSKHPYLKKKIDRKETTWQELYEHYDLFGEEDDLFKEGKSSDGKKDDNNENALSGLFDMLSKVDIDKIADGLNGMRKVLGILGELSLTNSNSRDNSTKAKPFNHDED